MIVGTAVPRVPRAQGDVRKVPVTPKLAGVAMIAHPVLDAAGPTAHRVRAGKNPVRIGLLLGHRRRHREAPLETGGTRVPGTAGDPRAVPGTRARRRGRTAAAGGGGGTTLHQARSAAAPIPRSRERRCPGHRARRERGGGGPPPIVAGTTEVPGTVEVPGMKWTASIPEVPGVGGTPPTPRVPGGRRRWRRFNRKRRNPA